MHGILTFWKESRISKILAIILPFPLLLVALLLSPVEVFASSDPGIINSPPSDFNFVDINPVYNSKSVSWNLKPTGYIDQQGQFYELDYNNSEYELDTNLVNSIVTIVYEGNVSVRSVFSTDQSITGFNTALFWGTDSFTLNFAAGSIENVNAIRAEVISGESNSNYNSNIATRFSNQTSTTVTVTNYIGSNYNPAYSQVNIVTNLHVKVTAISNYISMNSVHVYFENMIKQSPAVSISNSSNTVRWALTEYSLYEILNILDTKLWNIWYTEDIIHKQMILQWSQDHTDLSNIINIMSNDSSGVSNRSDTVKNQYDIAQDQADTAIDNAVHNYSTELNKLKNVNTDNFFTNQSSAVTFWRDLGEWILDSNNIGFMATGLIICTLITVFVFLLRL